MRRLGYTLVEMLTTIIVFGIVMGGLFVAYVSLWKDQAVANGMTISQVGAKQVVWDLVNAFRGAALCTTSDSGCVLNSGIQNASATGCTIYSRNSSGTLVQTTYSLSNGNLQTQIGSGAVSTLTSGATLALTYYTSSGSNYNTNTLTTFTPTTSNESTLIAVGIAVTVTQGGETSSYTTLVRLNNGP